MEPKVGIIMGSDSDLAVMSEAAKLLDKLQIPYELTVISAHRTPQRMYEYAHKAHERGIKVIIAGAGGAAHLPGMTAAMTCVPVIGVPVKTSTLSGVDSLYSICQMPPGIPVATVGINASLNAAILAVQILSLSDKELETKFSAYKEGLKKKIVKANEELKEVKYQFKTN